jgi:hypothetical protein
LARLILGLPLLCGCQFSADGRRLNSAVGVGLGCCCVLLMLLAQRADGHCKLLLFGPGFRFTRL